MAGKRSRAATKGLRPSKTITGAQRKARKINIAVARKAKKRKIAFMGKGRTFRSGDKITVSGKKGTVIPSKSMQAYVFRAKGSVKKAKRLGLKSTNYDRRLSGIDMMFIK